MNDYIYCVESNNDIFYHYDREEAFEFYESHHGTKIFTKTKDLFPTINVIVDMPDVDTKNIRKDDIVNMTSVALRKAVAKYDQVNTKQIKIKLNLKKDKEILDRLEEVGNKQLYIKNLIKKDIEEHRKNNI